MKKPGDDRRSAHVPTLGDMISDIAEGLSGINDRRYQRFVAYDPIPVFKDWLRKSKRVNVAIGANKSTKTTMGIVKAIAVYTGIVPKALMECWPDHVKIPRHRPRHVRIIVQDYTKHWPETIRPILLDDEKWGMLPISWSRYDDDEHMFYGPDGSYLSIIAINPREGDQDKINNILRGPIIDHTYVDELQPRAVFTESLTRNATAADGPATVDLGFCPQEGYDWTYDDFYLKQYGRDDHRLPTDHKHVNVVRVSMRDNPSVSQEAIEGYISTLKPWEVAYRVDGRYSARAGDPYFNVTRLDEWNRRGMFSYGERCSITNRVCNSEMGVFGGRIGPGDGHVEWAIWEKPRNGEFYIAICDSAEGTRDSDYQNCDIFRCSQAGLITTDRPVQVAQLHIREMKPGDFIEEVCCMATVYGECLLAYEINNTSGGTVRDRSRNYSNLYRRVTTRTEVESDTDVLGWYTDGYNKPAGLEQLYSIIGSWPDDFCGIRSPVTYGEMLSFQEKIVRDKKTDQAKRIWGPSGKGLHDDTITTAYIMAYILRFQNELLTPAILSGDTGSAVKERMSPLEEKAHAMTPKRTPFKPQPSLKDLARHAKRWFDQRRPGS
jgi:hypothetical protein